MEYLKEFDKYIPFGWNKQTPEEIKNRLDKIKKVAKDYENAWQFSLDHKSDYGFLRTHNLMDQVKFKKRTTFHGPKLHWTPEEIAKEADKYYDRTQFMKKAPTAYQRAIEYKLIDALFPDENEDYLD